jgi:hypothetical protein
LVTLAYTTSHENEWQTMDLQCGAETDMVVGVLQSCGVLCGTQPAQGEA